MKKFSLFFTAAAVIVSTLYSAVLPSLANASANLIDNPSAETSGNGTLPTGWTSNSWGTNTASFAYSNDANSGTRSLMATLSNRTDGDAKWMHTPAAVAPSTSYTYSDYYKATVPSEVVLQYTDTNNAVSYAYLAYVPASDVWKQVSASFTTPANVSKVVALHIVAQNGTLLTDDHSLSATVVAPPVSGANLLTNPSLEVANGAIPAGWASNKWGNNITTFTYNNTGRTGGRSVSINTAAYSDGDAKWYAEPASVTAGAIYSYKDYYQSNVATRVVLAYVSSTGAVTYNELPVAPASAAWAQYSATFTVPANVNKVYVYHLLSAVGSLTIDDVALALASQGDIVHIANGSLEAADASGTAPSGWRTSAWGTNTPTFAYVKNGGHTGTKSAKVTIKNYTTGDAKWFFEPTSSLIAGKQYRFTTWYKTNAKAPKVVVLFIDQNGVEHYAGLQNPVPSGSTTAWQQYTDTFMVPQGTQHVSAFMLIAENGWLQTDDYTITDYKPTGFNRPLLTMTFDDGHEDNVYTALPMLNKYGFKSTQCYATSFIENDQTAISNVKAFYNAGHEICSHTVSHPALTTLSGTKLTSELSKSQQLLQSIISKPVKNFASPYGDYNSTVIAQIKKYYQSHRTVDAGYNSKDNFDAYRLRVQNVLDTTTASQIDQWVKQAQADNTWLILLYHRVADDPGAYDTSTANFAEHLAAIQASGITVRTYQDALTEVKSQL